MQKILRSFYLIFIICFSLTAQEVRNSNLLTLITNIKTAMPGNGSFGYVAPSSTQQDTFAIIIDFILAENYSAADSVADFLDYSLYEWYDTANSNHLYYVLMENNADIAGSVQYGWGTFIFDPSGYQEVIIEAPHPRWDTNTWKVAFVGYQYLRTKYFLMAGAHRYANGSNPAPADVAHNTQNMFHVVHQKVSPLSTHSLQVHGFNSSSHPGYPNVVLSNGSSNLTAIVDSLANNITNQGYSVGIYDGIHWTQLGATTNTQGQWSRANGYSFIHMELDYFIRIAQSEWENVLDALYFVFLQPLVNIPNSDQYLPAKFELKQNYPNPFNSNTTIPFSLSDASPIELSVYNVLGEKIWKKAYDMQSVGQHKIKFDPYSLKINPFSGGVYFLTISNNQSTQSIKLIYLP
jgi:hypothetical protein